MGDDGEAPAPGYYAYGTTEGEGDRNDQKERHGKGTAYFANGDRCALSLPGGSAGRRRRPAAAPLTPPRGLLPLQLLWRIRERPPLWHRQVHLRLRHRLRR